MSEDETSFGIHVLAQKHWQARVRLGWDGMGRDGTVVCFVRKSVIEYVSGHCGFRR